MNDERDVHQRGSFYVRRECCLTCGVPQRIAPELFGWNAEGLCFLLRQPSTKDELDQVVRVLWAQEVGCWRYGGDDPSFLKRLAELGIEEHCDIAPAPSIGRAFRNHVTFRVTSGVRPTAFELAEIFLTYLELQDRALLSSNGSKDRHQWVERAHDRARFSYSWAGGIDHPVEVIRRDEGFREWLIRHSPEEVAGSQSVSFDLHDWLTEDDRFSSIRWYTAREWNGGERWHALPW